MPHQMQKFIASTRVNTSGEKILTSQIAEICDVIMLSNDGIVT